MKKILLPALALLLASCGFHLKGTGVTSQPLPYQNWHVEGGAVMQKALENALRRADGHPVSEAESQITIRVVDFQQSRDIYTITRAAKLNEYLFSLRATAQAYRNGHPWGAPLVAEVRRPMPYSDGLALGKDEETETIWRDMQNDAAAQLVRQLGFLNKQPASEIQSK